MNTGGPAFPGTLLDWYAGQETLADYSHPDATFGDKLAASFASPKPAGGWAEDPRGMFEWEAKVRAGMKYTRAAAMLAEKARREATGKDSLTVQDHCPDAAKMIELEAANRELVEALEACNAAFLKFAPQEESAYGAAWVKVRATLSKHKGAA